MNTLYHLMRADFLERVRRYSFFIVLAITVFAGYMFVPPVDAPYATFVFDSQRGYYNSPWVGTLFGVVVSTWLALIGFYLVKNAVTRDYETQVGQIIATTPISKALYLLGKWASNVAVMVVILGILTIMAGAMQLLRAENLTLDPWALAAPIWFIGLPSMAVVSGLAVFFESVPFLRGGFGNVVYFFTWSMILMASGEFGSQTVPTNDVLGLSRSLAIISQHLAPSGLDPDYGVSGVLVTAGGEEIIRSAWNGIDWTAGVILERLMWFGVAALIVVLGALPFDRFDPARGLLRVGAPGCLIGFGQRARRLAANPLRRRRRHCTEQLGVSTADMVVHLTPVAERGARWRWRAVFLAELRLMLKGRSWLWHAGAGGVLIAALVSPLNISHRYLLPAAWLWPILLWSAMGNRERRSHTDQIIFSVAHPLRRQLPAIWSAGFTVALITGGGVAVRLIANGQSDALFAWCVGAAFIPSLALALGTWSGGSKLFEVIYVLWWYLAFRESLPLFDYMGVTDEALAAGMPLYYLGFVGLLLGLAVAGRRRQIQSPFG